MSEPPSAERGSDAEPTTHGLFVQAPIPPLDENGIVVTSVGTVTFLVAAVILYLREDSLAAAGERWWFAVAITGTVLGLIGLLYCWRRRGR